MTGLDAVLLVLLVLAIAIAVYVWRSRNVVPAVDPRIDTAVSSLPQIQQEIGAMKNAMQGLPSEDVVRGIERRLANLEAVREDLGAIKTRMEALPSNDTLTGIQDRLTTLEVRVPNTLPNALSSIGDKLTTIASDTKIADVHTATQRLVTLLAGGRGRGGAGEFLVGETLKLLPPTMLERDFKVGGKTVEFALVLPNSKRLPLDSKWTAAEVLDRLEKETDLDVQQKLIDEVEKVVLAKAAEVAKYRNPTVTTDVGIAAIPDAAYRVCRKAHLRAYQDFSVLVVPYSMLAPYVLALFNIHLKYAQAIEWSNLQEFLNVIEKEIKTIDQDLEGRIKEASTRASNAYDSIKIALAKIKAATEYLKTAPRIAPEGEAPEEDKTEAASAS